MKKRLFNPAEVLAVQSAIVQRLGVLRTREDPGMEPLYLKNALSKLDVIAQSDAKNTARALRNICR